MTFNNPQDFFSDNREIWFLKGEKKEKKAKNVYHIKVTQTMIKILEIKIDSKFGHSVPPFSVSYAF